MAGSGTNYSFDDPNKQSGGYSYETGDTGAATGAGATGLGEADELGEGSGEQMSGPLGGAAKAYGAAKPLVESAVNKVKEGAGAIGNIGKSAVERVGSLSGGLFGGLVKGFSKSDTTEGGD